VFEEVATRKPLASRDRSTEVYLLGKTLKPDAAAVLTRHLDGE